MRIVAGPWLGELGWELMKWQGILRKIKKDNLQDFLMVVCKDGHEGLYQDFADQIIFYDKPGNPDGWFLDRQLPVLPESLKNQLNPDKILQPSPDLCNNSKQEFIVFGEKKTKEYDLLLHARKETKLGTEYRNWETKKWNELFQSFKHLRIASIGSKGGAHHIDGTKDLRGVPISELLTIMRNSRLTLGPSSGPMHMASLCKCTHIVWSDKKTWSSVKSSNRERYEKHWNPLNTKVIFIDEEGWRPSAKTVIDQVRGELK